MIPDAVRNKTLLFNTFFFSKLTSKSKPGELSSPDFGPEKHHKKVEKWLKNVNVFNFDYLIVPVNRSKHWFLLIVCNHSRVGRDSDVVDVDKDEDEVDPNAPCILIFDSLNAVRNGGRVKLTDPLRSLLEIECKIKEFDVRKFDSKQIPDRRIIVTEQDNYYDCGLYLLQYVEQFLKNPAQILASRSNNHRNWVDRKVMIDKRNRISDIIHRLSNSQRGLMSDDEDGIKVEDVKEEDDVKGEDNTKENNQVGAENAAVTVVDELMDVIESDVDVKEEKESPKKKEDTESNKADDSDEDMCEEVIE
jgi:sentrin-specific protease 7